MILVMATAAGLAGARSVDAEVRSWTVLSYVSRLSLLATPLMTALALAMLIIRLRSPRPRRVFRQPGMVASCAAAFSAASVILQGVLIALIYLVNTRFKEKFSEIYFTDDFYFSIFVIMKLLCGFGIATAWLALSLAGCWRPEPGWIDRAGILLGICWVVLWGCSMLGI
jgi:hypothetical protein